MSANDTYKANKAAKCGSLIVCPVCGTEFVKRQYSQSFCCGGCKDKYHNGRKPNRHKKGYYSRYNAQHPERLERGYTKGYVNGNFSEGAKEKPNGTIWYDALGRPHSRDFLNPTFTDLLDWKCFGEWHDDDWCEEPD